MFPTDSSASPIKRKPGRVLGSKVIKTADGKRRIVHPGSDNMGPAAEENTASSAKRLKRTSAAAEADENEPIERDASPESLAGTISYDPEEEEDVQRKTLSGSGHGDGKAQEELVDDADEILEVEARQDQSPSPPIATPSLAKRRKKMVSPSPEASSPPSDRLKPKAPVYAALVLVGSGPSAAHQFGTPQDNRVHLKGTPEDEDEAGDQDGGGDHNETIYSPAPTAPELTKTPLYSPTSPVYLPALSGSFAKTPIDLPTSARHSPASFCFSISSGRPAPELPEGYSPVTPELPEGYSPVTPDLSNLHTPQTPQSVGGHIPEALDIFGHRMPDPYNPYFSDGDCDVVIRSRDAKYFPFRRAYLQTASDVFDRWMSDSEIEYGGRPRTESGWPIFSVAKSGDWIEMFLRLVYPHGPKPWLDTLEEVETMCDLAVVFDARQVAHAALARAPNVDRADMPAIFALAIIHKPPMIAAFALQSMTTRSAGRRPYTLADIPLRLYVQMPRYTTEFLSRMQMAILDPYRPGVRDWDDVIDRLQKDPGGLDFAHERDWF